MSCTSKPNAPTPNALSAGRSSSSSFGTKVDLHLSLPTMRQRFLTAMALILLAYNDFLRFVSCLIIAFVEVGHTTSTSTHPHQESDSEHAWVCFVANGRHLGIHVVSSYDRHVGLSMANTNDVRISSTPFRSLRLALEEDAACTQDRLCRPIRIQRSLDAYASLADYISQATQPLAPQTVSKRKAHRSRVHHGLEQGLLC